MRIIKYKQIWPSRNITHYWGFIEGNFIPPLLSPEGVIPSFQFTGKKDSNNKEIYENDFITTCEYKKKTEYWQLVKWEEGYSGGDWGADGRYEGFTFPESIDDKQWFIVGNVIKNPNIITKYLLI